MAAASHFDHVRINVKADATGPGGPLSLASNRLTVVSVKCNLPGAGPASGAVVYPVAEKVSDRKNWGGFSSSLRASWNTGTDFSVPCGSPVRASHAGTVSIESRSGPARS